MENKCTCLICGKIVTNNNSYIGSHVKRTHKISLYDYVEKYYNNLTPDIIIEKCGFCDNNAIPNYIIDHIKLEYSKNYKDGYFCNTDECKQKISLDILKCNYNKSFEYIGSLAIFLSKKYKISLEDAKKMKNVDRIIKEEHKTNLKGYILRYGEEEGLKKYNERCKKISKSNSKIWYIEKFGQIEGETRWNSYIQKIKNKTLGTSKSKSSQRIFRMIKKLNIIVEEEKPINENRYFKMVDFYLPEYNIAIEYFGDYWHMNPNLYPKNFFNKTLKITAEEVWNLDRKRNIEIMENIENCSLLIIWETTKIAEEYLLELLGNIKNKKTIMYI